MKFSHISEKREPHKFYAWLVYDRDGAIKNRDYIEMHKQTGEKFGIHFELKYTDELQKELPDAPDFAIVRAICPFLSKKIEAGGIPVFNNAKVAEICNHKGRTIQYVKDHTDVAVLPTEEFANDRLTKELLAAYPDHVIKAVDGHGGQQVFRTSEAFDKIRAGIGKSDFILQPFLHGPGKDVRVYVIGNEIVGAACRTAADGFRSNFSLGGEAANYVLREEERACVEKICGVFSFGLAGIDFLIDPEGKFVFNEIEDVVGARMLYKCNPEIALLEKYFSFIIDKMLHNN